MDESNNSSIIIQSEITVRHNVIYTYAKLASDCIFFITASAYGMYFDKLN